MYPTPFICGLQPIYQGKKEDYPLLSAEVHYDLCDVQMLANLKQTYTSNASIEAEIRYVFPLPSDASVCSFKAIIDGKRTVKGVVKEKAEAKAKYEQAVAQGKTAALLQQANVEIFQVSLGNIRYKQTIEIHISFVSVISHDGNLDSIRLTFPSAIAPRYGSGPSGILDSTGYNWGSIRQTRAALDFSVAVEMTSPIKAVTSPSHPIAMKFGESTLEPSTEFNPFKARVSLSSPTLLEKDIVIVLNCQGLDKPRCMVESFSPEEGGQDYTDAYALTLVPRFELPTLPVQEYIFLVDRSGSMGGGKMDAVRSALQIMLMSLPARDTSFNIISFGTQHSALWPSSVTYSADSVKAASAHVDSMSANFGGTEIRHAIEAAFASRAARSAGAAMPTSVFVLTDGQAYDLDGVQSMIKQAVSKDKAENVLLRVFCMGIGNAVSKAMCDGIARAGQGTATFVGEQEKPDQKLMGLLRAARGAVVQDISIDWGVGELDATEIDTDFEMVSSEDGKQEPPKNNAPLSLFDESHTVSSEKADLGPEAVAVKLPPPPRVQQAPAVASLPPLYPGFRTSLFAIVRRGKEGNTPPPKSVRIKGSVLGRPVALEVPVTATSNPTKNGDAPAQKKMLHVLAARALIQDIEDRAEKRTFMSEIDKANVVRLAEQYELASSQTSFVAIDEEGEPVDAVHNVVHMAAVQAEPTFGSFSSQGPSHIRTLRFGSAQPPPPPPPQQQQQQQQQLFQTMEKSKRKARSSGGLFGASAARPPTGNTAPLFGKSSQLLGGSEETDSDSDSEPMDLHSQSTEPSFLGFTFKRTSVDGPPAPESGGAPSLFGNASSQPGRPSGGAPGLFGGGGAVLSSSTPFAAGQQMGQMPASPPAQPGFGGLFGQGMASDSERSRSLPPTVESFARSQSFDGSFAGSAALFQLLVQQPQAPTMPTVMGDVDATKETLWCTLLCVSYLERKFEDEKDVWAMIVEKALAWVEDTLRDIAGTANVAALKQELQEEAQKCVV